MTCQPVCLRRAATTLCLTCVYPCRSLRNVGTARQVRSSTWPWLGMHERPEIQLCQSRRRRRHRPGRICTCTSRPSKRRPGSWRRRMASLRGTRRPALPPPSGARTAIKRCLSSSPTESWVSCPSRSSLSMKICSWCRRTSLTRLSALCWLDERWSHSCDGGDWPRAASCRQPPRSWWIQSDRSCMPMRAALRPTWRGGEAGVGSRGSARKRRGALGRVGHAGGRLRGNGVICAWSGGVGRWVRSADATAGHRGWYSVGGCTCRLMCLPAPHWADSTFLGRHGSPRRGVCSRVTVLGPAITPGVYGKPHDETSAALPILLSGELQRRRLPALCDLSGAAGGAERRDGAPRSRLGVVGHRRGASGRPRSALARPRRPAVVRRPPTRRRLPPTHPLPAPPSRLRPPRPPCLAMMPASPPAPPTPPSNERANDGTRTRE